MIHNMYTIKAFLYVELVTTWGSRMLRHFRDALVRTCNILYTNTQVLKNVRIVCICSSAAYLRRHATHMYPASGHPMLQ